MKKLCPNLRQLRQVTTPLNTSSNAVKLLAEEKVACGQSLHFYQRIGPQRFTVIAVFLWMVLVLSPVIADNFSDAFLAQNESYVVIKRKDQLPIEQVDNVIIDSNQHVSIKKDGIYAIATDSSSRIEFRICGLGSDGDYLPLRFTFPLAPLNARSSSTFTLKHPIKLGFYKYFLFSAYLPGSDVAHSTPNAYGKCVTFGYRNRSLFVGEHGFVIRFPTGALLMKPLMKTGYQHIVVNIENVDPKIDMQLVYGDLIFKSLEMDADSNIGPTATQSIDYFKNKDDEEEETPPPTTEPPETQDASVYLFIPVAVLGFLAIVGIFIIAYIVFVAKIAPRLVKKPKSIKQPSTSLPLTSSKPTRRAPRKEHAPKSDYVKPLEHVLSRSDKYVVKEVSAKAYVPKPRSYHPKKPLEKQSPKKDDPDTKEHNKGDMDSVIATVSEKKSEKKATSIRPATSGDETEDSKKAVESPTPTE